MPDLFAEIGHSSSRGGVVLLPPFSKQGKKRCSRHKESEAIGVGAKSLLQAIPMAKVEDRCPRPLTLRTFGGCGWPLGDQSAIHAMVSVTDSPDPVIGMFERSVIVLAEISVCRSRRSAPGPEAPANSGAAKSLVEVFLNIDEQVRPLPPQAKRGSAPAQALARGFALGLLRWKALRAHPERRLH